MRKVSFPCEATLNVRSQPCNPQKLLPADQPNYQGLATARWKKRSSTGDVEDYCRRDEPGKAVFRARARVSNQQKYNRFACHVSPHSSVPNYPIHGTFTLMRDPFGIPSTSHWTGAAIIAQGSRTKSCIVTAVENLAQADALLFGRVTYEMMEAALRSPGCGRERCPTGWNPSPGRSTRPRSTSCRAP